MIPKFVRHGLLLATIFSSVTAVAAEEAFAPGTFAAARSGYWIGAYAADPNSNHDLALLKYDNNDALVFAKPYGAAQGFNDQGFWRIVPLNDGGAIVIGESSTGFGELAPGYSLHRVDASGAPVWSLPLSALKTPYYTDDNFDTKGSVLFGVDNGGGVWFPAYGHIYRISGAGALTDFGQVSTSPDEDYAAAVDPVSGALYFVTPADTNLLSPAQILRYTTTGAKSAVWTAPDTATRPGFLTVGNDGNVYAIGNNASTHIALSLTASGAVRWSTTFGSSLYGFTTIGDVATQAAAVADGSIVALDTSGALYRVNANGHVDTIPNGSYDHGVIDGDTSVSVTSEGDIVLFRLGVPILRLSSTGQVLAQIPWNAYGAAVTVLSNGTLLLALDTPGGVEVQHLDRSGHELDSAPTLIASLDPPAQTRVDQIGLDGAWYATAESGQGFTIDYVASSNVLFIPWFTYSVDPVSDTSGLAWVSFQGSPTPGAKSATLQIARTEPGAFNSGAVPADVVGTAVLTATDCANARLQYKFNDGVFGGIGGYMPLVRLSPSTTPCIGANGQTTPPTNTNAPLHGFDANQSGSWYDPNTSGQGIEVTIVPAGNGYNGLVFGAWFTFDVPPANDALHEHWFTLQGDLSSALNGTVTLPIVQNVGGSLDSLPTTGYSLVGTVTLSMLSCTSATMTYHFDHSAAAKNFAGLNGTINLTKIGGCVAP